MAKIKILNIDTVRTDLKKKIKKAARSEEIRTGLGEIAVEDIKATNYGIPADKTIEWRKRYEEHNDLDPSYSRNKINISFTGELLDDLKENVRSDTTGGTIKYEFKHSDKQHKKYDKVTGKIGNKRSKYSDISKGIIEDHGYDYLKFSDKTLKRMLQFIKENIINKLK